MRDPRRVPAVGVAAGRRPLPTKARSDISCVEPRISSSIYYDYLSYLEPHAVRTFTNSLAWQRRMFGWVPSEPTTVLLQDFADYGNAHAYVGAAQHGCVSTLRRCPSRSRRIPPASGCIR